MQKKTSEVYASHLGSTGRAVSNFSRTTSVKATTVGDKDRPEEENRHVMF